MADETGLTVPEEYREIAAICAAEEGAIGGRQQFVVDARKLHAGLKVRRDFSNWIKDRLLETGAIDGQDYEKYEGLTSPNLARSKSRARKTTEYRLTLVLAKRISMMQGGTVGAMVQGYYIWCETQVLAGGHQSGRMSRSEVRAMMQSVVAETEERILAQINRLRGMTYGVGLHNTRLIDTHLDRQDLDLTEVACTAFDTKQAIDDAHRYTVREIADSLHVQMASGVATKTSNRLRSWCIDHAVGVTRQPGTRAYSFPRWAVQRWLDEGGRAMIVDDYATRKAAHKAKQQAEKDGKMGQTSMVFPFTPKKPA